ncbi:GFA family protein [Vibrio sp. LaRot3]|uniref:GFA family protein n=1 Tax=Vibrio sp. LaRot3 TaxID=2998829 RepID=UPI0022CDD17B|nr:GFA family protein [Vibrio sp. LaRot3]MDA0148984.1 GFA family protein [Vibrio sp. LaRot3]
MQYPINVSCQCGQVSYTLKAPPKMVAACHCKECQKLATAPFSVTAMVAEQDIEFTGELAEWGRMSDSGNRNHAKFCTGCGNRIYHFNPDDPSMLKLKLKPVDADPEGIFEPTVHVWVKEKVSWYQIPENVKVFEAQP